MSVQCSSPWCMRPRCDACPERKKKKKTARTWTQVGEFIWQCDDAHGNRRFYGEFPGGSAEVEEFYQQSERDAAAHAVAMAAGCED